MSVAKSYARALYEAAAEESTKNTAYLDTLEGQLSDFIQAVTGNREARALLMGPLASEKEKAGVIEAIGKKMELTPLLSRFLLLLAAKGRLPLLVKIRDALSAVRLVAEGGVPGQLVAAEKLSEQDVEGLSKAFARRLGKKVVFAVTSDASLLAGIKITIGGITYDGTLRAQLQRLRDRFVPGAAGN